MATQTDSLQLKLALSGLATVQAGFQRLQESIVAVHRAAVAPALGGVAALLGVAGLAEQTRGVLQLGSSLNDLKTRLQVTVPVLMATRKLLADSGGEAEGAAELFSHMQKSIVDAAEKGGAAAKTFLQDLGLDPLQLALMDTGKQFRAIGEAIASIESPAKRTQVAMEIFGRSGASAVGMFSNLEEFKNAFEKPGAFVQVMSRNASLFDMMDKSLEKLAQNGQKFMAGVLDQIGPGIEEAFRSIGAMDVTPIGQKAGALAQVIINSFKDGKFPEMLGLLVEAGFELGALGARRVFNELVDFLGSTFVIKLGIALANGVMTFGVMAAKGLLAVLEVPITYIGAGTEYVLSRVRVAFQKFVNWIKDRFADAVNFLASALETTLNAWNRAMKALGLGSGAAVSIPRVVSGATEVEGAVSWATAFANESKAASEAHADISKYLDDQLKASREILKIASGITGNDNIHLNALARLNALIEEQIKKRAAQTKPETPPTNVLPAALLAQQQMNMLLGEEQALKAGLVVIEGKRADIDGNYLLTDAEKYAGRLRLLQDEKLVLGQIVSDMQERARLLDGIDPKQAEAVRGQIAGVQRQQVGVDKSINALGSDPDSFGAQMDAAWTKMRGMGGTVFQQLANTFEKTFSTAVQTISDGITGLITGTKTWGEALMSIGTSIITSLIQGIVQMGVQWVLTHIVMQGAMIAFHALRSALGWSATGEAIAQETAKAPVLAANATTASIGSYGTAALIGVAALVAALGIGIAAATGAFAEGGYTGSGGKYDVAGVVHRGEFVMPAHAVDRIGLPALESMRQGGSGGGGAAGSGGGSPVQVHNWISKEAMMNHIRNNPEYDHHIVEVVGENSHKILPRRV